MGNYEIFSAFSKKVGDELMRREREWNSKYPGIEGHSFLEYIFGENQFRGNLPRNTCTVLGYPLLYRNLTILLDKEYGPAVISAEKVHEARLIAAKELILGRMGRVHICIGDAQTTPINSRNAPQDGYAHGPYPQYPELQIFPKKPYPAPPPSLYNWEPLTDRDRGWYLEEAARIFEAQYGDPHEKSKNEMNRKNKTPQSLNVLPFIDVLANQEIDHN